MIKKYDIVAIVGTYQKDGEAKSKFKNVGAMMEKDGKPFLLLDRTFNPAGVPFQEGRDTILLSLYTPKEKDGDYNQGLQQSSVKASNHSDLDDEIPF